MKPFPAVALFALLAVSLAACGKKTTSEKIHDAAADVRDDAKDAARKTADAAKEAAQDAKAAVKKAADKVDGAVQ